MGSGTISTKDIQERAVEPAHEGLSVANDFAGTLAVGTLVYLKGLVTSTSDARYGMKKVDKAAQNAGSTPSNRAQYVVIEAIVQNGAGRVSRAATLIMDTSSWTSAGDPIYLSTAGTMTPTQPVGAGITVQIVGYVLVKGAAGVGKAIIDLRTVQAVTPGTVFTQKVSVSAVTPAAGTTSTDAGLLPTGGVFYPTSGADGTKGVRVGASDEANGNVLYIANGVAAATLKVYPPTGGAINGAAVDAAFVSASGKGVILICINAAAHTWAGF
jgi:hypothetical protein